MGRSLTEKERVEYIRKGNELFNNGKYKEAETIFMLTNYKDGILRIANRYYYELKKPLIALKFYYKIGAKEKIEEIRERMLFALKRLIKEEDGNDKTSEFEENIDNETNKGPINPDEITNEY